MGLDRDNMAVADEQTRVHGIEKLRVVDECADHHDRRESDR